VTSLSGICDGRVAIVTGAGRGIGREYALELARQGARVVVNDLGAETDGTGASTSPARDVVELITSTGGEAVIDGNDVSDWDGARQLVERALSAFGRLDVLVNNAGILRDRMIVNMEEPEWDDVIRVHLKGTFAPTRWAARHWREVAKSGGTVDARIINTTSSSGLYGNPGQANYGAAKAGIAGLTVIASLELARYGVTVNAIAPSARTRMTENLANSRSSGAVEPGSFDFAAPTNIAPLVAWLASERSASITGRVFNVQGGDISVAEAWHAGPGVSNGVRWAPADLTDVVPDLVSQAQANPDVYGRVGRGR
jgi:NAD(P)-dependent dehydrogenase (short-subunit alcohol dehydrogenase family)